MMGIGKNGRLIAAGALLAAMLLTGCSKDETGSGSKETKAPAVVRTEPATMAEEKDRNPVVLTTEDDDEDLDTTEAEDRDPYWDDYIVGEEDFEEVWSDNDPADPEAASPSYADEGSGEEEYTGADMGKDAARGSGASSSDSGRAAAGVPCRLELDSRVDYLTLVNKKHPVDANWANSVTFAGTTDTSGNPVKLESGTYQAYLQLKEALAAEGIYISIGSAYRSVEEQQGLVDEYTVSYGKEYVKNYVAVPGYSEHHTGLAIDLNILDVDWIKEPEEKNSPQVWKKIHARLADYGFILRYQYGKEDITGYNYEEWHIRFVGSVEAAHAIQDGDLTLEEYLDR